MEPGQGTEDGPVASSGLVNHGDVVCGGLIVLHPAAIHERQATLAHQPFDLALGLLRLLRPPSCEERLQAIWCISEGFPGKTLSIVNDAEANLAGPVSIRRSS